MRRARPINWCARTSWNRIVAVFPGTLKRDTLAPMVGFKYGWDEPVPSISFKFEPPADLQTNATVTKTLNDAGWERDQGEMEAEALSK